MERQAKDGTVYKQVGPDDWEPVTRQAKDGTVYKKIGADEWTKADESSAPQQRELGFFESLDSYTGAPVRSAIGAMQDAKNPISAYAKQFGQDPQNAPTGRDIAVKAGVSDVEPKGLTAQQQMEFDKKYFPNEYKIRLQTGQYKDQVGSSPAAIAGFGIDVAADPLNLVPVGAMTKGVKVLSEAPKLKQAARVAQSQTAQAGAQGVARSGAKISGGELSVELSGQPFKFKAPQSLDELKQWKPAPEAGQQVGATRLKEIETAVEDLQTKPLKYHYSMMENPKAMKELKLKFENLPTEDAKRIAAYNQEMVDESARKIKQTVSDLARGEPRSLSDAGYDLIGTVKDKYKAEKEALGPMFEAIQTRSKDLNAVASKDLIQALGADTKVGKLLAQNPETGRFYLSKNTPRTGLSDSEHQILSRVIDDLNDGMSFKEVQDVREFMRKAVDPANPGATSEINKARSIMLGQLEHMAGSLGDDVGQTFKRYAVNERTRESFEKIIGGKIESLDAMFAANPDRVVQKIFSNPNYTDIVRQYVGQEKMQELVASHVQTGISKAFDSAKGWQPQKFKTWLKSNEQFLKSNVDPKVHERLNALADYGYFGRRFLDEVNPSGTAASLKEMLEPGSFLQKVKQKGITGAVTSEVGAKADSVLKQRSAVRTVNEMMGAEPKKRVVPFGSLTQKLTGEKALDQAGRAQIGSAVGRSLNQESAIAKIANEKDRPEKGPEKWANDGFDKLIEHAKPEARGALQKLRGAMLKDPKLKDLLIRASDLKPGSPAMERIFSEITKKKSQAVTTMGVE